MSIERQPGPESQLGGVIGLQATIWVGAIGAFLGFLPVLLSPVRSLKEIPSSEPA